LRGGIFCDCYGLPLSNYTATIILMIMTTIGIMIMITIMTIVISLKSIKTDVSYCLNFKQS